ncbi:hypothetical protein [Pseudomonas syringae]|uniref:Uncharacterized protein n=1 Tax=Pseudomonas syringae pv. papulans TaxID=83963 RepID=A0AA43DSN9_PSESX|nr:hypothetical protein [Pseudomonas syringae]MDH4604550.1 hypothetical protein [Pseudomonas syringae pv. papulans]MDH4622614.1 hypothetical protein [Pseudomonas syringae pv. papulans]
MEPDDISKAMCNAFEQEKTRLMAGFFVLALMQRGFSIPGASIRRNSPQQTHSYRQQQKTYQ